MREFQGVLAFINVIILLKTTFSQPSVTLFDIKACDSNTKMFCYGQCVTLSSNCELCEGTGSSICTKPTATADACIQPGFLLNLEGNCVDCRSEDQCLVQCDGFWDRNLNTCLKQRHKTFKVSHTGTFCNSFITAADCNKCRDQQYVFSQGKCVQCPSSQWNKITMKCIQASVCEGSQGLGLLSNNSGCGICQYETTNKYLDLQSNSCTACPIECNQCGTFTSCLSCKTNFTEPSDNPGFCECKGNKYFDGTNCTVCPMQGCAKCKINSTCVACQSGYAIDLTTGICSNCADKFENCSTCDSSECLTCQTDYVINSLKACVNCPKGQYFASSTQQCTNCSAKCSRCTHLTGVCTECINNYDVNSQMGVCECKNTKTLKGENYCVKCSDHIYKCSQCSSINTCTVCIDNYDPNSEGYCECKNTKTLNSVNSCVLCSSILINCIQCLSPTICTVCQGNFKVMQNGQCSECQSNQYYNSITKTCQNCPFNCQTCLDDSGQCTGSCKNNYRLDWGSCICIKDRLIKNSECILCSELFVNCQDCNSTSCIVCLPFFVITSEGCKPCKEYEIYNENFKSCIPCNNYIKNCLSCSSTTVCTACVNSTFQVSEDGKSCLCPSGNYLTKTDGQCLSCSSFDPQCLACSSTNVCTQCSNDYPYDSTTQKCRQEYNQNHSEALSTGVIVGIAISVSALIILFVLIGIYMYKKNKKLSKQQIYKTTNQESSPCGQKTYQISSTLYYTEDQLIL